MTNVPLSALNLVLVGRGLTLPSKENRLQDQGANRHKKHGFGAGTLSKKGVVFQRGHVHFHGRVPRAKTEPNRSDSLESASEPTLPPESWPVVEGGVGLPRHKFHGLLRGR